MSGAAVSSFCVCCGWRFANSYSLLVPRSFCESCHKQLNCYQLIPLIGFLIQKGRCFFCGVQISFVSPIVETLFGFYAIIIFFQSSPLTFLFIFLVSSWSLLLSMQDFYSHTVSGRLLLGGSFFFLIFPIWSPPFVKTDLAKEWPFFYL
ncbi:prepilin peptidase [Liquorilactobacillus oeni]